MSSRELTPVDKAFLALDATLRRAIAVAVMQGEGYDVVVPVQFLLDVLGGEGPSVADWLDSANAIKVETPMDDSFSKLFDLVIDNLTVLAAAMDEEQAEYDAE